MSSANVTITEVDLSARIPSFPGCYGAILIPNAAKGPTYPYLCTNETDFLKTFTPNSRVEVGYDMSYYSSLAYLEGSNKLWVKRVLSDAAFSGAFITKEGSLVSSAAIDPGSDPTAYDFDLGDPDAAFLLYSANEGVWGNSVSVKLYNYKAQETLYGSGSSCSFDPVTSAITVAQDWTTGSRVTFVPAKSSSLPVELTASTVYYVARQSATSVKLATTLAKAVDGDTITIDSVGTGTIYLKDVSAKCKEPNAFTLEVYWTDVSLPSDDASRTKMIESWVCSRTEGAKDGYGQNMFIEDVLEGSLYLRALNNDLVTSVYIKEQTAYLALENGSDSTTPVTDSNMLLALGDFRNPDDIPVTLLMDGGWATASYQKEGLDSIAQYRMDCVALLSTPDSVESSSNYLNEIVDYKRMELNLSSSYSAIYSPHVKITDKFNDRKIYVSPEGFVGAIISKAADKFKLYYPPAGFKRGMLNVLDVRRRFSRGEMDYLYDNNVNPLRFAPGRGILVWGQKTTQTRPSHLDRLNVRLMLITIEPSIKVSLEENFLFEFNNVANRLLITAILTSAMNKVKTDGGVYDFMVTCDETNNSPEDIDNHILNVWLFVKPMIDIEYIPTQVIITRTGVDFSVSASMMAG